MIFKEERSKGIYGEQIEYIEAPPEGETAGEEPFTIHADKTGVTFKGRSFPVTSILQLEPLASCIDRAWKYHQSLKRRERRHGGI